MIDRLQPGIRKWMLMLTTLLALSSAPVAAQAPISAPLAPLNGSTVTGRVTLTGEDGGSLLALTVSGVPAGARVSAALHAGTCAAPSASFAALPAVTADASGTAAINGRILFRGTEDVAIETVADGEHVILVNAGQGALACAAVPAMAVDPLGLALIEAGQAAQTIQLNPVAALQRHILADGFVPTSGEFGEIVDATPFVTQRAERLADGAVRVYFVREGLWDRVQSHTRGQQNPLGELLLESADARQVIQLNPAAALQRRILTERFVPTSGEFEVEVAGTRYVAQRAEQLGSGEVRVYYARLGDWSAVRSVGRPPAG